MKRMSLFGGITQNSIEKKQSNVEGLEVKGWAKACMQTQNNRISTLILDNIYFSANTLSRTRKTIYRNKVCNPQ